MKVVTGARQTGKTLDEAPMAYKDTDDILGRIHPTADVVDTLTPKLNIKAE